MDFFNISSVSCDNFRIERFGSSSEYHEIRKKISTEKRHYQTGELTIDIPRTIETIEEAKEYSLNLISKLRLLLSFSHGHDVPIHELMFYRVKDNQQEQIGHERHAMWFGTPGSSSFHVLPGDLNQFLQIAMPLLNDETYVSKTGIKTALNYYNAALTNPIFMEIRFTLFWLSLEAMANAYYENNTRDEIITRAEWKNLKKECELYLMKIGKVEVYEKFLAKISLLRRGTIKEKIDALLSNRKYQMQQYSSEIRTMYDEMRVPFFHGQVIDWAIYSGKIPRLERVLEKLIFKTLDFYENKPINNVIKDDDLSAR
jgi:hypothetical protein